MKTRENKPKENCSEYRS